MKRISQRLVAMLVVLALMATGLTAFAEVAKLPTAADVYARGNTLKTEIDVQLDTDTVIGLTGMLAGSVSDPGQAAVIANVANAINKLTTTILSTMKDASITVGTEKGSLLSVQASMDEKGALAAMDLIPGIHLKVPDEMMKAMMSSQASFQAPEIAEEALEPYVQALNTYVQEKVLGVAQVEEGSFDIEGVAQFTSKYSYNITGGMVAGLITTLTDLFREDTKLQGVLDEYLTSLSSASAMGEGAATVTVSPETPASSADLIKQLDEMAAKANAEADNVAAVQRVYLNKDNPQVYVETESPEGISTPMLLTIASLGDNDNADMRIELLMNMPAPSFGATPEATEAPAAIDWKAVKAAVLDGTNTSAMLLSMNIKSALDADKANILSNFDGTVRMQGMLFGLTIEGKTAAHGNYAAEGKVQLTALTPSPLLTVLFKMNEVTEKPAELPSADKVIEMKDDELSDEDKTALNNALEQALPGLMERLKTVLPEEGPVLVTLMQQMMQPPAPATAS